MRILALAFLTIAFGCFGPGLPPAHAQGPSAAASITEISVCTQEWVDSTNSDMTGLYWDTFKAVFEPVGVKINVAYMPYKVSIVRVQEKTCDVALGGYLNEHSNLLYSQWPLEIEAVIAVHPSDKEFKGQKRVGRRIGDFQARVLLSFFYYTVFAPFAIAVRWVSDPLAPTPARRRPDG